jgi:hypothetical protein
MSTENSNEHEDNGADQRQGGNLETKGASTANQRQGGNLETKGASHIPPSGRVEKSDDTERPDAGERPPSTGDVE